MQAHLAAARATVWSTAARQAVADAGRYFARRAAYLGYAERLRSGQSIGSGMVEGASAEAEGARWRVRRANRMATLCCTLHGDAWRPCWCQRLN